MSDFAPPRMYARPSLTIVRDTPTNYAPAARVELLAQRFHEGQDLWTGEDLVGEDLADWEQLAIQRLAAVANRRKRKEKKCSKSAT